MAVLRERLVLSLPPDPGLAHLARLATLHFLRQNGVKVMEARRRAHTVECRSRELLRAAARGSRREGASCELVMTGGVKSLEVVLRRGARKIASLLQVRRDRPRTG